MSVIVPTVGRPSLARTLRSLLRQGDWLPWEAVLVGDTLPGPRAAQLPLARELAPQRPRAPRYVECDGGLHAWGHPQRNHGATVARGTVPLLAGRRRPVPRGRLRAIGPGAAPPGGRPPGLLFRWIAPWKQVLWHTRLPARTWWTRSASSAPTSPKTGGLERGQVSGRLGFIRETVDWWGGVERVVWQPGIIAQAQPTDGRGLDAGRARDGPRAWCRGMVA